MTQIELELSTSPIGKWKRYSVYKDSGIEWLGEIPEHWGVKRLKYAITMNPDVLPEDTDPNFTLEYVDISNVDSSGLILNTQKLKFENAPSRARRVVRQGDTIISTVRTYLRAISLILETRENLVVSTGFAVLRPNPEINREFLWRLVQSNEFVNAVVSHSEGVGYPAINPDSLSNLPIWLPSLPEQQSIAAFLDHEITKINALIAKKERLIELLQEKRSALISHAVTKGLDANVPMKDSGVEWLGEIPTHWEVKRIRDITRLLQTGPFGSQLHSNDYISDGIPVINPSHIRDGHVFPDWDCTVNKETFDQLKRHELHKDDIVFARRGEMGRCALVTKQKQVGFVEQEVY